MRLEDIFSSHQAAVFAYLLRTTGDWHLAEELTQETFFRAFKGALMFRGDSAALTWLIGIARHVLMEASRKGAFREHVPLDAIDVAGAEPDIDQRLDLQTAFGRLPLVDREVLMLVDFLGFSPSDAAGLVGVDPGALRMRLHRARHKIRSELEAVR